MTRGQRRGPRQAPTRRHGQAPGWRRTLTAALAALTLTAASACGGSSATTTWDAPAASEAEAGYRQALASFESGQLIEATKQFNYVRLKFPYSGRWTSLAELRLADILFEQGAHAQAAEAYRQFILAHPTHEEVAYASFRVGLSYYEQLPSDFFILPEQHLRDLASSRLAEETLRRFLAKHPDSAYVAEAQEKHAQVREILAQHELYAAEYYFQREHPLGALNRALGVVEAYEESQALDEALFLIAHAYVLLNDVRAGAGALQALLTHRPQSELAPQARAWLLEHQLADVAPMAVGWKLRRERERQR